MLEDRDKNIVYVPISRELLPSLGEWSEPVEVRAERDSSGELNLVFRALLAEQEKPDA